NYRGMQFQESLVEVKGTEIYGNKSAIRARDSELRFVGNRVFDNYFGPNLYRITGEVSSNLFSGNLSDGLRVREGGLDVKENTILTNRYGLTVAYANFGSFHDNIISYNQEIGIALKGTDNIKVSRNFVQLNGVNGMSILTASAEIQGNHFADNGERGIGVISFKGLIEGNNFVNNGLYAIGLDGVSDISAPNNWWGSGVDMEKIIFDRKDKAGLGLVDYEMALEKPVAFTWPVPYVLVDTVWDGEIQILQRVDTSAGTTLRITPGTTVRFGIHRGMWANGNIEAIGTEKQRILFTRLNGTGDDHWHQIRVEKAQAVFDYCDFEYGETALHTHASDFRVVSTRFTHNQTGMMLCLGGTVVVNSSIFRENALGLVLNKARGEVRNTIIAENEVGIMVRAEDGRGMQISNSNIFSNARYNLKMGDFNKGENIDVRDNFWGTDKPGDTIFDDRIEPGLGRALFEPFAQQALEFTTN
ncbi:MAG: right-handed parallel beta-helix repeat-containing protein, partial [Proteobacteria bacterium]|nr:right-handed parallel beta-helix repeat-containing protein [Pseudomonadota bacterium]